MRVNNSIFSGILIGLVTPLVFLLAFYFLRFASSIGFLSFVKQLISLNVHTKILALSVYFSNFILFFIFVKADYLYVSKGILIATILYTLLMVIQRFL